MKRVLRTLGVVAGLVMIAAVGLAAWLLRASLPVVTGTLPLRGSGRRCADLAEPWREGRYRPMLWTRADIEADAEATLSLLPAP